LLHQSGKTIGRFPLRLPLRITRKDRQDVVAHRSPKVDSLHMRAAMLPIQRFTPQTAGNSRPAAGTRRS
jgi:hypothetical protein